MLIDPSVDQFGIGSCRAVQPYVLSYEDHALVQF